MTDLLLLQLTKVLPSLNVPILVAKGKLKYHNNNTIYKINDLGDKGLIVIKELDDEGYEFVLSNRKEFAAAGSALLEIFYLCKTNNAILIVDEEEILIRDFANKLQVRTSTLDEFNQVTVNNKEYFEFINEMKKDKQRLNL
ncbi:hypothetical protein [Pedobacter cryophilus]|uniref:Uncharacterized protein n=1 Tax=Pedobacter cryophilus TaxID=2571271 RepID=A0A4U1C296_9SPHI|nr:hypothetical protein [Pedobacter cryophilus]TKB99147.1 hypothetical protein FA046_08550 [Pedobacter cryophilus]